MKIIFRGFISLLAFSLIFSCSDDDNDLTNNSITISGFDFIGERVIPDGETYTGSGSIVGGLSSIDYANGTYYVISDSPNAPIRFYTIDLTFDKNSISGLNITSEVELLDSDNEAFADGIVDPESIRFDPTTNKIIWTSEGSVNNGINPFVRASNLNGTFSKDFTIPQMFQVNNTEGQGIRHNGVFEGLSLSVDNSGYWTAMELPLEQDGDAPVYGSDTDSPVRIAYIDKQTGTFGKQFAYELDPVARDGGFKINGVVEVLQYQENKFIVLERSYASGTNDGGNDVHIYDVDISNATDVSAINSLNGATYTKATKKLLFDFESVRSRLTAINGINVVDNIEGITFGPDLPNGNKSLVLVADNNFSAFGQQLNQFIVLEVLP